MTLEPWTRSGSYGSSRWSIADALAEVLAADSDANVVVLGDLNDVHGSVTLAALTGGDAPGPLTDLVGLLPEAERYSYVFAGQSEAIDHILVSPSLRAATVHVGAAHGNAGVLGSPSDHDPLLAQFALPPRR